MQRNILVLIILLIFTMLNQIACANKNDGPVVVWEKSFGTKGIIGNEEATSIIKSSDGGYLICGHMSVKNVDNEKDNPGKAQKSNMDIYIIKISEDGKQIWKKRYGGIKDDKANGIIQTKDGGYAVCGWTESCGSGDLDVWLLKLDKKGNKLWGKTYGGKRSDSANSIIQLNNGDYVVCGNKRSNSKGRKDVWVLKLDENGNKLWDKSFGGYHVDLGYKIIESLDGGFIISAATSSVGNGSAESWIINIDTNGNKVWDRALGGKFYDSAFSIMRMDKNNYLVCGKTKSFGSGHYDVWILKLDKDGNKVWDKTFGGSKMDIAFSTIKTSDGNYLICGYTSSYGLHGDMWLIKIDKNGNEIWSQNYGKKFVDSGYDVIESKPGEYVICGFTRKEWATKGQDWWIIKVREQKKKK